MIGSSGFNPCCIGLAIAARHKMTAIYVTESVSILVVLD